MGVLTQRRRTLLVAALAAQRLVELRLSAANRRRSSGSRQASPRTYPAMVAAHVALFAVSAWPRPGRRVGRPVEMAALTGLGAALGLRLWVIRILGAKWNVTAHVDPDMQVVTAGPYRRIRHPNYAAVILEFACLPLAVGALPEAVLLSALNGAVLVPRIRAEEALLDAVPGYRAAFAGVPRLLPWPGARLRPREARASRGARGRRRFGSRS